MQRTEFNANPFRIRTKLQPKGQKEIGTGPGIQHLDISGAVKVGLACESAKGSASVMVPAKLCCMVNDLQGTWPCELAAAAVAICLQISVISFLHALPNNHNCFFRRWSCFSVLFQSCILCKSKHSFGSCKIFAGILKPLFSLLNEWTSRRLDFTNPALNG